MNSGEAFDKAVAGISGKKFENIKIGFDVCCVVISLALSLIFFDGKIVGTREGTVLTVLLTGGIFNFHVKCLSKPLNKIMVKNLML